MRKVQDIGLAVNGIKIPIYKTQNQVVTSGVNYNLKHIHHIAEGDGNDGPTPAASTNRGDRNPGGTYREVFKLRTAKLSGSAVQTERLREIRESVEIADLKRLLRSLGEERSGDGSSGGLVTSVDANKIYREFFQVHYDFLRNVVDGSS